MTDHVTNLLGLLESPRARNMVAAHGTYLAAVNADASLGDRLRDPKQRRAFLSNLVASAEEPERHASDAEAIRAQWAKVVAKRNEMFDRAHGEGEPLAVDPDHRASWQHVIAKLGLGA